MSKNVLVIKISKQLINTYAHLNEKDLKEAFSKFKQESTGVE